MAEKEDFYKELDAHKKRSYCTCQTMMLGFFILTLIIVGLIFSAYTKIKTVVMPERKVVATSQDTVELRQKFEELAKTPGASTALSITEQELTAVLTEAVTKDPSIPLRSLQAEINPTAIVVSGVSTKILKTNISLSLIPKVVGGAVKLELVKVKAGSLAVPASLTELLSGKVENLLGGQLGNLEGVTLKSIDLRQGRMIISGTLIPSPSPSSS